MREKEYDVWQKIVDIYGKQSKIKEDALMKKLEPKEQKIPEELKVGDTVKAPSITENKEIEGTIAEKSSNGGFWIDYNSEDGSIRKMWKEKEYIQKTEPKLPIVGTVFPTSLKSMTELQNGEKQVVEEFKIGDWIVPLNPGNTPGCRLKEGNAYKLSDFDSLVFRTAELGGNIYRKDCRKALPNEIPSTIKDKFPFKNGDIVRFEDYYIDEDDHEEECECYCRVVKHGRSFRFELEDGGGVEWDNMIAGGPVSVTRMDNNIGLDSLKYVSTKEEYDNPTVNIKFESAYIPRKLNTQWTTFDIGDYGYGGKTIEVNGQRYPAPKYEEIEDDGIVYEDEEELKKAEAKKLEKPKLEKGKVYAMCLGYNNTLSDDFIIGKVYEVKDGIISSDKGHSCTITSRNAEECFKIFEDNKIVKVGK